MSRVIQDWGLEYLIRRIESHKVLQYRKTVLFVNSKKNFYKSNKSRTNPTWQEASDIKRLGRTKIWRVISVYNEVKLIIFEKNTEKVFNRNFPKTQFLTLLDLSTKITFDRIELLT